MINLALLQSQDQNKKAEIDAKVEALLKEMTLEEKIGQMNQYNGFWDATGPTPSEENAKKKYDDLKNGLVGSVLNVVGVKHVYELQKLVVENSRLKIPLIFGQDVIHGYKTTAPIPLAEAASWDMQEIENSARVAAIESAAAGINWTFAPMVDIYRDARWGRVMEGGGEDPYLGSAIAKARVKGFQGKDLSAVDTIAACAKHFVGYGFSEAGREYHNVDFSTATLYNFVLPPFKAAIEAGVRTFMNAFNLYNGVPSTGNAFLQREILKGRWKFDGFVVSDWGSVREMVEHGYAKDLKHSAELAANAGSDMDMESHAYIYHLKELVEEGKVDEKYVDDAARRILRVKFELGLFDDPYKYCSVEREEHFIGHRQHKDAVLEMAKKSIVLLKNENNLLPLKKEGLTIALIGPLADDRDSPLGSWRLTSDNFSAVSVLDGLKHYKGNHIKFAKGADLVIGKTSFTTEVKVNETDHSGFEEAIQTAKKAEVVIMVLGENAYQSGEARSRANIGLPGVQQELLEAVYAVNPNIVLVLMNGRPLAIPWAAENLPAIIEAWQLGEQTGNAIAKVLYGDYNPSGKLPMTFPRSVGQLPLYYNQNNTGRPEPVQEVFWSHYIDESNKPLYPFGFGLSYTTFEYSDLKVLEEGKHTVKVSVNVTNTGNRQGEEVVQLYIRDLYASIVRPVKELKGFEKIALEAGETQTVHFTLTEKELGFFDNQGNFIVESGDFDIMVGGSSDQGLMQRFILP